MPEPLTVVPVTGLPEVVAGDDVAALVVAGVRRLGLTVAEGDVFVVSSKIASKAMGLSAADRDEAIRAETVRVVAERYAGGLWTVRRVSGVRATRPYRCPGCQQEVLVGTPHVVVWAAEGVGGLGDRRQDARLLRPQLGLELLQAAAGGLGLGGRSRLGSGCLCGLCGGFRSHRTIPLC